MEDPILTSTTDLKALNRFLSKSIIEVVPTPAVVIPWYVILLSCPPIWSLDKNLCSPLPNPVVPIPIIFDLINKSSLSVLLWKLNIRFPFDKSPLKIPTLVLVSLLSVKYSE